MTIKFKFPYERKGILDRLILLTDAKFRKTWFDSNYKHAFWDSLEFYILDGLYNASPNLMDESEETIGVSLYNKEESDVIKKYLDYTYDLFEPCMPDNYYVTHLEAEKIAQLMEENNKKYDYNSDMEDYNLEMKKEREKEICERIDSVEIWSKEEKQALKEKMITDTEEEFFDITNEIAKKVWLAKGGSKEDWDK